jgi:hypothetical protein
MLATLVGNVAAWSVATLPAIKGQLAPLPTACEGPLLADFVAEIGVQMARDG